MSAYFGPAALRGRSFLVGLSTSLKRGAELLFLLAQNFATAVSPTCSLLSGLLGALAHELTSIFRSGTQHLSRLFARTRSVQNTSDGANSQSS
jgi:hypothetical protein